MAEDPEYKDFQEKMKGDKQYAQSNLMRKLKLGIYEQVKKEENVIDPNAAAKKVL